MLRIAIVGSGFGRYGLLPAFAKISGCEVVAICGKDSKEFNADVSRYEGVRIYRDWKKMLEAEELDAVAVAVTPRVQFEVLKTAMGKGLHVFAEKPLALDIKHAKELLRIAKQKKITHGVDFIFPAIPAFVAAKKIIVGKKFGKLRHISVNWEFLSYDIKNKKKSWKTTSKEGGGALSFYFSHGLHYLEDFVGPIQDVRSVFTYSKDSLGGAESAVDIVFESANGVTGQTRTCCNCVGVHRHQVIFQCERGTMILENAGGHVSGFTLAVHTEKGLENVAIEGDPGVGDGEARVQAVRKIATRFVKSASAGKDMRPSFEEGLRVQELIEQIRKSAL